MTFFDAITNAAGPLRREDVERAFTSILREPYQPVPLPPHPQVVTFRAMPWQLPVVNDPRSIAR